MEKFKVLHIMSDGERVDDWNKGTVPRRNVTKSDHAYLKQIFSVGNQKKGKAMNLREKTPP